MLHHYYYKRKKTPIHTQTATSTLHQRGNLGLKAIFWAKILGLLAVIQSYTPTSTVYAQGLLSPTALMRFSRSEYEGGSQNWAVAHDQNNRVYIANNEGLLVYNGTNWRLYPVPNKTILRAIAFGVGGRLYAGAQDELGYYAPDAVGRLQFSSLKHLLSAQDRTFADVWQVVARDSEVFFRTNNKIFRLRGDKFNVYTSNSAWLSMHKYRGQIIAHDKDLGLLVYRGEQWQPFVSREALPANFFITDLIHLQQDTCLLSTVNDGLYLLTENKLRPFVIQDAGINTKQHFTALVGIDKESFWVGTYFNGLYRVSKQGIVLEHISTKNGMPNNTVRCLAADTHHNVWAGLDNGLALLTHNTALKHINPPAFNNGAGYDAKILDNDLYFALSTGVLRFPLSPSDNLSFITEEPSVIAKGLTWNLSIIGKQLLAGRDNGLFVIDRQSVNPIAQSTGYWGCRAIPQSSPLQIIAGNYLGLDFFEQTGKSLREVGKLDKFAESCRYIETDGNSVWISHPYRGIYRIMLPKKSIRLFSQKDGLPTNLDNHVFKIKGRIVFATPQGIYEYHQASDKIIKSAQYLAMFGNKPIRYLKEDDAGNIWFVQEKMLGVLDVRAPKPVIHYIPEVKNKIVSGFENIFPYDMSNVLIGAEPGFYHLNYKKYLQNIKPFEVYIAEVKTSTAEDSVLFGGYVFGKPVQQKNITIPYKLNSLLFSYTASVYEQPQDMEYSYYLEGFDKAWSHWNKHTKKEYTNLPAGTYTFKVKARKSPSHESAVHSFAFAISPPWHQTIWAYMLYVVLVMGFLLGILTYQSRRYKKKQEAKRLADLQKFEEQQRQQAYQHQLALAKSEKEIAHLRNEKLDTEIQHKNAELANATMNLVQKKEFILKLKKELQQLQKNTKIEEDNGELKKLLKVLAEEEKLDEEWDNFALHFNSVHGEFLTILKQKFPVLNPHDLRLCAYLRMNLSSKEIAPLLGISLRGVEISRYRLRKKLSLPTEANLVEYLMNMKIGTNM